MLPLRLTMSPKTRMAQPGGARASARASEASARVMVDALCEYP